MSTKRGTILAEMKLSGLPMTLDRAVELVGDQYHNQRNHTGNILAGMVKAGLIERVEPGLFRLPKPTMEVDFKLL